MKFFRLTILLFVVVGLVLLVFNTILINGRWLFINTNFGPLQINSNSQITLFFNELGKTDASLIFMRNKEISSIGDYRFWNPREDFGNYIVFGCKTDKILGMLSVVSIDVDIDKLKLDNYKTNDFLPTFIALCFADPDIPSQDKMQKLIDISREMIVVRQK